MGTVAIQLKMSRKIGFDALFETGKGKPLSRGIKAIRASREMAIRNIRPAVAIVASLKERLARKVFVSGVVANKSNSAIFAGIFIVRQFIILGIEQMKQRLGIMKFDNLLMKSNDLFPFFGIACNGDAGDREFKSPLGFNSSCDDGVVAKDLFDFIGIGRFTPHADASGLIVGQFRTAKMKRVGRFA